MAEAEKFVGATTLEVITVRSRNPKKPDTMVCVRQRVVLYRNVPHETRGSLTWKDRFSLTYFEPLRSRVRQPCWWHLLDDLFYRRTDVAAQHVAQHIAEHGPNTDSLFEIEDTKSDQWQAPQRIDFDFAMQQAPALAEDCEEEDRDCIICRFEAQDAVVLNKCQHHRFCREHITEWLNHLGPEKARCALCQRNALSPEEVPDVQFGLLNGVYHADPRYSDFENFERSCADLDEHLAENAKTGEVDWPSEALAHAWELLVAGARLETADSCPLLAQPVRTPEFARLDREIGAALIDIENFPWSSTGKRTVKQTCDKLYAHGRDSLQKESRLSGLSTFSKPNEQFGPFKQDYHVSIR